MPYSAYHRIETQKAFYCLSKVSCFLTCRNILTHLLNTFSIKEEVSGQFLRQNTLNLSLALRLFDVGSVTAGILYCNVKYGIVTLNIV